MSIIKTTMEYHQEIQLRASQDAYKCTCHYLKIINGNPEPHATGVLVKIDDCHFLFTAAHVSEDLQNEIVIGIEEKLTVKLGGEWTFNNLDKNQKRKDDKIDIAILKLDDESVDYIKRQYSFINQNQLGINHEIKNLPYYTAIGFPASKNRFNKYKGELKSSPFIYNTVPADEKKYKDLNCKEYENLILTYEKKRVIDNQTKRKITGPDPYGISGGGVWFVPTQLVNETDIVDKKLVSILTEWSSEKNIWISTRIDLFTEVIRQKYKLGLPESKIIKLNTN
ncbi:hypothetical protein [Chryseobacterium sp. JV558]|uniref:hypothetical protein n=1 Tax=Chryseobacterium sp. JV558 TaxID=2663236 RepID=UPI00299D0449|nr:hypothetical protein [Chryseobacterium sp. JV558]MDW9381939.1 hypothetical protein [Chryseobacterium sp. JV558]